MTTRLTSWPGLMTRSDTSGNEVTKVGPSEFCTNMKHLHIGTNRDTKRYPLFTMKARVSWWRMCLGMTPEMANGGHIPHCDSLCAIWEAWKEVMRYWSSGQPFCLPTLKWHGYEVLSVTKTLIFMESQIPSGCLHWYIAASVFLVLPPPVWSQLLRQYLGHNALVTRSWGWANRRLSQVFCGACLSTSKAPHKKN